MSIIAVLEFELAYYDFAALHVSHNARKTYPLKKYGSLIVPFTVGKYNFNVNIYEHTYTLGSIDLSIYLSIF